MRFLLSIFCFLFLISPLFAQVDSAEVYRQLFEDDESLETVQGEEEIELFGEEEEEDDDRGIPVFVALQPALYLPNNAMANYYNGAVKEYAVGLVDRLVIQTIWDNPNNKPLIIDDLGLTQDQYDGVFFDYSNFNYKMRYDIGYLIGFQAFFMLQPRLAILLGFNFVSLNTASVITIDVPESNGTPNSNIIQMEVFGKEQRFVIDLGLHTILGKRGLKYYIEGGGNFLMAKVNDNYFKTSETRKWNLHRQGGNNLAANTITSFSFGGFFGAGFFFQMNENFAFEFGPQLEINSIEYPGYGGYFTSVLVNLRIIYLSKNSEL